MCGKSKAMEATYSAPMEAAQVEKKVPRIEVFSGPVPKPNPVIRLALKDMGGGGVKLVAVDEYGEQVTDGNILSINREGRLDLAWAINENIGLSLDGNGQIELAN